MLLLGVRLLSFFQGCIVVAMGVAGMGLISFDGGDTAVCFCHLVVLHHCCYFFPRTNDSALRWASKESARD